MKGPKFKMLEEEFNISFNDTIFITDSTGDIVEAREVGYKSIGIRTGVHSKEELLELNPEIVVDSFEELEKYIEKY
jgi:phosphoglycolate phosphatase-like HAD superfamily hydrolase